MSFTNKVKQAWTKALQFVSLTEHNPSTYQLVGHDYRFGTQSRDFLLKAYGLNPYVFMVIDRICQRLIQIDKNLLDRNGKEAINPDFTELWDTPNTQENGDGLLYRASATYLAAGECFLVREQELGARDQYFVPVNYNVTIHEDTKGDVLYYTVVHFGLSKRYLISDVLHIRKPDVTLDTNHGFSTLRATRKVWESNNEVWGSEATLHKNKGITGVLYSDGNRPMTDKEQTDLQSKYDSDYTGQDNFGKVKVSTSKLGYIQMGMNPNDLKSIETRLEHLRTICASYNVDSKLFGDSAASTYNNMAEARRAMITDAVLPLSKVLLPEIVYFMAQSVLMRYTMELDENSITELQLTNDQMSARLGREVIQGLLKPQEARRMLYPELAAEEDVSQDTGDSKTDDTLEDDPAADNANAQAQAALRGTVGGVQGILAIQQSVVNETTSRESAVTILMTIYGFDEQTANDILG